MNKNYNQQILKASVVILTKNPGAIFKQVLNAVIHQNTTFEYEIIVIDSGSTDGTLSYLQDKNKVRLTQILPQEFGHGKTRNLGVSLAHGEFVVMLTHDAMPANADWLENIVAPFEDNAFIAGVFGRHIAYPDHSIFTRRDLEHFFNSISSRPKLQKIEDFQRYNHDQVYRESLNFFSDNNACLRKSVWELVPYPDVNYAEDQAWSQAILKQGYSKVYAHDAVVYHSHDYSILNEFRRSYDDIVALKGIMNYVWPTSLKGLIVSVLKMTLHDIKYIRNTTPTIQLILITFHRLMVHFARRAGRWTGNSWLFSTPFFYKLISRDNALRNVK